MKRYIKEFSGSDNNKGFSLVELIIVIAILALLVAIVVPNFIGYLDKARKARDMEMARVLGTALERVLALDEVGAKEWDKINVTDKNGVWFNVEDPYSGQSYKVYNGFEWTLTTKDSITDGNSKNARYGILRDPYKGLLTNLRKSYAEELAQYDINIFYRKYNIGQYRILKRADNGKIEVWVCPVKSGTDGEGKTNGFVYYRLYPNPDPEYMSNKPPKGINANDKGGSL